MSLTNLILRKPLLPPPPLGFQMKPLNSLPPLGRFVPPLGQNFDAEEFIYPSIQTSETNIYSAENLANSSNSESTSDIQLAENQDNSDNNSSNIFVPNKKQMADSASILLAESSLQDAYAPRTLRERNTEINLNDYKTETNDEITVAPQLDAEEKPLPEPLESLKPLAQNSDFYISRFVADYLSNKPGIYSSALSRSQNQIIDNQNIDNQNIENTTSVTTSEKDSRIEPIQQVNKLQTQLETVTSNVDDDSQLENISNQDIISSKITQLPNSEKVFPQQQVANKKALDSTTQEQPIATQPTSQDNNDLNFSEQSNVIELKVDTQSQSRNTVNPQTVSQPNTPDSVPQKTHLNTENINQTSTDLSKPNLNLPAIPNLPQEIISTSENAPIQTSKTENKLQPQLESPSKTSSEAIPNLNLFNNKTEIQNVHNSQTNIQNTSANSENTFESKYQPSKQKQSSLDSPLHEEKQNTDSEFIQSQLDTSETSQIQFIKDNPDKINFNQTDEHRINKSENASSNSLTNNFETQSSQITGLTNIQKPITQETVNPIHPQDNAENKSDIPITQTPLQNPEAISLANTSFETPQTFQTNDLNIPPWSKVSPLIQESDLQLSKFVSDFSNLSDTYTENIQPFIQSSQKNDLYNFENTPTLQKSPDKLPQISNNFPETNFNIDPNTDAIDFNKSIDSSDEADFSLKNSSSNDDSNNAINLTQVKRQNNHIDVKHNHDNLPNSWSNISELIDNTSPEISHSHNIPETDNQQDYSELIANLSSLDETISHTNKSLSNDFDRYTNYQKVQDSQPYRQDNQTSNILTKDNEHPSTIINQEITSSNSANIKDSAIKDEDLDVLAYQIYSIIRQKLEVDRESVGKRLLGYPEWSNIILLNMSIVNYQENAVDLIDAKMNFLAEEVYKLIAIRLETEKEISTLIRS
ncbi:MAG: hypothetical protein KI793_05490 [Rivularia sp. (in: Bacteria)]|nr:hypothetical protein [Rivularia sp. MS3]